MRESGQTKAKLKKDKIIAVIRFDNAETSYQAAKACIDGGLESIEITMTIPRPHRVIERLAEEYEGTDVMIGAGTVLDAETARIAMLSGADFIVSPTADTAMLTMCNRYGILSVAGACTSQEIQSACENGAGMIKLFPSVNLSPDTVKALRGPFPTADFMVTGTLDETKMLEWLSAGIDVVGIGGGIVGPASNGNFQLVRENAVHFRETIHKII